MKKYLMTGIAALALCAGFTGCSSHDIEEATPENLAKLEEQKIRNNYEKAFVATFGQPAANQEWGFGSLPKAARTRAGVSGIDYTLNDHTISAPTAPIPVKNSSKPDTPTFNTQMPEGTLYAQTNNPADNTAFYIDNDFTGWSNPQNNAGMTIYAVGNDVKYLNYQTKDVENTDGTPSTTIIVTEGSTLTLSGFSGNVGIYLAERATLNLVDGATLRGKNAMLYLSEKSTVNAGESLTFINNCKILNEGGTINVSTLYVDGGALIYNQHGLLKSTTEIKIYNTGGEIVNNDKLEAVSFNMAAGALFLNTTDGTVDVTGTSYVTNTNCQWKNEGYYKTQTFYIENCRKLFNNCKLDVTGNFNFVKNSSFVIDANNSVKAGTFTWGTDCDFYMSDNSLLLVEGTFTTTMSNTSYGLHGVGTGYSILKAASIAYDKAGDNKMNYYGNIFVDTDIHFDQGFLDPDNKYTEVGASQPYYYFSTKKRTVKFKFLGDKCPIESTIDPEKCYHGYTPPTTPDDPYPGVSSLRIMAEDLSASEASDFDFNDVVFDVVWKSDSEAEIILQAAGGTLPLTVNGVEVHGAFEVETNVMVNTNWTGTNTAKHAPVSLGTVSGDFTEANFCKSARNIKIMVQKGEAWYELTANKGEACCKFGISTKEPWVDERTPIENVYNFGDWVKGFITTLTRK